MQGFKQEFDTIDTPINASKIAHQDLGHLDKNCYLTFFLSAHGDKLPIVGNDSLSEKLQDHEGQVGDDKDRDDSEGEVGSLLLGPGHVGPARALRKVDTD